MFNKMRFFLFIGIIVLIPLFTLSASEQHGRDVSVILDDILKANQVESIEDVDPNKVSPALLEELGDSVMGLFLDSDWRHDRMDAMLGGEGSESLAIYHKTLGIQYLKADGDLNAMRLNGYREWHPGALMGSYRFSPFTRIWTPWFSDRFQWFFFGGVILLGGILIVSIIILYVRKRPKETSQSLSVLKIRYAKGEISKQEYDHIKRVLH